MEMVWVAGIAPADCRNEPEARHGVPIDCTPLVPCACRPRNSSLQYQGVTWHIWLQL